jgi:hypothetical protein
MIAICHRLPNRPGHDRGSRRGHEWLTLTIGFDPESHPSELFLAGAKTAPK